jgi:hypothetical protein
MDVQVGASDVFHAALPGSFRMPTRTPDAEQREVSPRPSLSASPRLLGEPGYEPSSCHPLKRTLKAKHSIGTQPSPIRSSHSSTQLAHAGWASGDVAGGGMQAERRAWEESPAGVSFSPAAVLHGMNQRRILHVAAQPASSSASASASTAVVLQNVRLIGGKATRGGAILVSGGAELRVSNCELLQSAAVWGGAVYTDGPTTLVRSVCRISPNTAERQCESASGTALPWCVSCNGWV